MIKLERSTYCTIVADPPWPEYGGGKIRRGADRHYPLMSVKDILAMGPQVQALRGEEGCHLYLWVTNNFLPVGLQVMEAWGFTFRNFYAWEKSVPIPGIPGGFQLQGPGLGQYVRSRTELCLFGVYKALPYKMTMDAEPKRAQGQSPILAPRGEHSEKPVALMEMAELVSYPPRLEMFARARRSGWDAWGDGLL